VTFYNRKFTRFLGASTVIVVAECVLVLSDSVIAGRVLGETALGAMALLMPLVSAVSFFTWLLAVGTAVACSDALGRLQRDRAAQLAGQGLVAACLLGLVLAAALSLFLDPYLSFLTSEVTVRDLVLAYGRWYPVAVCLGAVDVFLLSLVYTHGGERCCIVSFTVQTVVNVALSYALCDGRCGLPALGMAGISLGTAVASTVGLVLLLTAFLGRRGSLVLSPRWMPAELFRSAGTSFGDVGAWLFHAVLFLVVDKFCLSRYGVDALPVIAVVFCLVRLTAFFTGVGLALRPLEMVYQGEGNELAVRRLVRFVLFVSFAEELLVAGLVFIAPELIVSLVGIVDPEQVAESTHAVRLTVVGLVGYAIANLINSYSRHVGSSGRSVFLTALAFLGVPTSLMLAFGALFGMTGVYLAVAVGPLVSLAALLPLFRRTRVAADVRVWSASLGDRLACADVVSAVGQALSSVVDLRASRRLTDVLLLTFKRLEEANGRSGRRVSVEVSLLFGDETVQLIVRDDGCHVALDDLGLPVVHLPAAGFNRNIFAQPLARKRGRVLNVRTTDARYVVLRGRDATPADIEAVIALDRGSFDERYQVDPEQDRALFLSNQENGLIVKDARTGEVVGYSMILPLREDVYERVRSGRFVDTALTGDMVVPFDHPGDDYRIYFASVVIHPRHRGASLLLTMVETMVGDFIALAERGIFGRTLTADVVSREGEKLAQLLGLTEVCKTDHGSRIFEATALPPELRETTASTERLIGMYWEHFVKSRLGR